eukprot:1139228-Pelagomonas_calceolata.AAC.2
MKPQGLPLGPRLSCPTCGRPTVKLKAGALADLLWLGAACTPVHNSSLVCLTASSPASLALHDIAGCQQQLFRKLAKGSHWGGFIEDGQWAAAHTRLTQEQCLLTEALPQRQSTSSAGTECPAVFLPRARCAERHCSTHEDSICPVALHQALGMRQTDCLGRANKAAKEKKESLHSSRGRVH